MKTLSKYNSNSKNSGKVAVITGASSGVGLATALTFAKKGYQLALAARGSEALAKAAQECESFGATTCYKSTDMSKAAEVQTFVQFVMKTYGRIDVWVNNAGVMASGKFEDIPMDINEQVIKTNLFGYMHGAYYVLPIFKEQNEGILINNVSIAGYMPAPFSAMYTASKHGIKGLMSALQSEYSVYPNIHICNIYPQVQRSTGNMHSAKFSNLDFKIPPFAADPMDTAKLILKLANSPKNDTFPDTNSLMLKTMHDFFPHLITNLAHAPMRAMMKLKNADDDMGNILQASGEPHKIYGETSLPVPSKAAKKVISVGLLVGLGILAFRTFTKSGTK